MLELTTIKGDLPGHPFRGNQWTGGSSTGGIRRDLVLFEGYDSELDKNADFDILNDEYASVVDRLPSVGQVQIRKISLSNTEFYAAPGVHNEAFGYADEEHGMIGLATGGHAMQNESAPVLDVSLVDSSGRGSFRHEFGHLVYHDLNKISENARYEWEDRAPGWIDEGLGHSVSSYGATRPTELFAEAFSMYSHRDYGTDERLPKEIEEFFDRTFGKQKSSRLAIAKQLLSVATQAVQLKRLLLKDQLRNAVVKAVHVKQYEETERELADAVAGLIKRQFASASKTTKKDGSTVFDPRDWDGELIDTCLPVLMKHAGEAAAAQMLLMGVDVAPRGKRTKGDLPGHPFRGNQWTGGQEGIPDDLRYSGPSRITLYRAADDDFINSDSTSFSESRDAAEQYRDNPGYGGSNLYKTKVEVDPDTVLDLTSERDPVDRISGLLGITNPGAIGADEYVPRVADKLLESGVRWVRVNESFPEDSVTWIHMGGGDDDPEMVELKSPSFIRTKASRATEWLLALEDEGEDLSDLWPEVFSLPGGGAVDLAFATEWPAWMKAEITKQMKECFEQPFWAGINDTTAQGIQNYVEKGLLEGWSIREIQQEMVGDGLDEYYRNRGQNIARTESGNALNGARSAAMDRLQEEVPGLKTKKTWMSVLGTTTRDSHAQLDGVPADKDGLWYLGGVRVPWPGHWNLPVGERACCQCTLVQSWGMDDAAAEELIADYNERLAEERAARDFWTKGDYAGHPFRGNQWGGGGGSSVREHATEMISHLETIFEGPGRAAAVNEVLTAAKFPEYLKGILEEVPGVDEIKAVVEWSVRRGRVWEAA